MVLKTRQQCYCCDTYISIHYYRYYRQRNERKNITHYQLFKVAGFGKVLLRAGGICGETLSGIEARGGTRIGVCGGI